MKCTESPKYSECVMTSDLRRKRRNCTYARDKKPMTNYERIKAMSVEEMAAADVVPVVRCKDCKYLELSGCYGECGKGYLGIVRPDCYCCYGERRIDIG